MIFSIPSLVNVFALLFLIFFIYSVLGVFLFRNITSGLVIDDYANFKNFGNAMTTLFRCSTGEDWHRVMFDTMKTSNCTPGVDCGSGKYEKRNLAIGLKSKILGNFYYFKVFSYLSLFFLTLSLFLSF